VVARPASASELCECTSECVGSQRDTGRGCDGVQDLLYTEEVPAGGLVRIAGGKKPRCELLEILRIPILLISQMNADEDLLEC
jgi:hypothetical protein